MFIIMLMDDVKNKRDILRQIQWQTKILLQINDKLVITISMNSWHTY